MKTVTKSQMAQNPVIKRNQRERKKILKKICENFNIMLNKSQIYYSYQQEILPQQFLGKGRVQHNLQKSGIIIDESIIVNHEQVNYLNENNQSGKIGGIEKPDQASSSHFAPPIDFVGAALQIESSNSNYLCSDGSDCQNNTESEIENRICEQVSESMYLQWEEVYSEFFEQFRQCYDKHMKQVKNILRMIEKLSQINRKCCKNNVLSHDIANSLPSGSKQKVEFPKLDQIQSIQQLSQSRMPSQIKKQNWISLSMSNNHQSRKCEEMNMNANIRQQKSVTIIPTDFIKEDLSCRLSSNLDESSNEECLSGSNYLPQTKIEKVSIHQMEDSELLFYKSQNNYMKKSWSVFQCKNQEQHLKELLCQPSVNQPNQCAIQDNDKCKANLKKLLHNETNSQKNKVNIQQLETLMIKSGLNKEILNSSHSQRCSQSEISEVEEEKSSHQHEEEMREQIKRKRMYVGFPFLVNVRSRKK